MTDLNLAELDVELLPARTTMAGLNAIGGRAGNGGTSILSAISLGIINEEPVNAAASDGANAGSAANVVSSH